VTQDAIINISNDIWHARNSVRFNSKHILWKSCVAQMISNVSITASHSKLLPSSSMSKFMILKAFRIKINLPKENIIREVIWYPPIFNWIKCNCDGRSVGSTVSCEVIFRNKEALFLGCFAEGHGSGNSYYDELCGAMKAIQFDDSKNWKNFVA